MEILIKSSPKVELTERQERLFLIQTISDVILEYTKKSISGNQFDMLYELPPDKLKEVLDNISQQTIQRTHGKQNSGNSDHRR